MNANPIMTDREVAMLLNISVKTLQRRLARPVTGEIDLSKAEPRKIGSRRFWVRTKVESIIGIK